MQPSSTFSPVLQTRSLLNTAKVMEGNPVALRMKELETLERVAERIGRDQ